MPAMTRTILGALVACTVFIFAATKSLHAELRDMRLVPRPVVNDNHVILPLVKGPLEVYSLKAADTKEFPGYLPSAGRVIGHPAVSGIEAAWAGDLNRLHAHQFADLGADFDVPVGDGIST